MRSSQKPLSARDRIILAVDTSTVEQARCLVDELCDYVGVFKVGLQLFMNAGPAVLDVFQERGLKIFFDGKFLDIENTVAWASEAIARRGVDMFSVHATGGRKMLEACVRASREAADKASKEPPIILGVTVLTSLSEEVLRRELNVACPVEEQVVNLALLCKASGLTGIVASAEEVPKLRAAVGPEMILVTPGVRPHWADVNDQSRVVTPAQAMRNGSDYVVIGRPITHAKDRREAAKRILEEMQEQLKEELV